MILLYQILSILSFLIESSYQQERAIKKCQEYAKETYFQRNISDECQISSPEFSHTGDKASLKEFPHMASIGFAFTPDDENLTWLCGGSLISENFVLTAAHCSHSQEFGKAQKVRLGMINVINPGDQLQQYQIENFIKHPKFHPPLKYHDIALIKTSNAVTFNAFVRPACLNFERYIKIPQAQAIGFGKTSMFSSSQSPDLLKVVLDIIPKNICKKLLGTSLVTPLGIKEGQLCAGSLDGERDTCEGDSGGPLQIMLKQPYCMYSIIAVTSFGRYCGYKNSPGIYTDVFSYLPWIEHIIYF